MYGIANCDTIKKAKTWLQENQIEFEFHDYKKQGIDEDIVKQAITEFGIDIVVNKRGTTYRKLDEATKANLNENNVVSLLKDNSSMIKRPIVEHNNKLIIGFSSERYEEFFNLA